MRINIESLKPGDVVAYRIYDDSDTPGKPPVISSKVKKVNFRSVTLRNGQVVFFDGNFKGCYGVLVLTEKVHEQQKKYRDEINKREKIDKAGLLLRVIKSDMTMLEKLTEEDLDSIISHLDSIAKYV